MKRSNRSIRRYRDSQAKLIIAKRRYQDALKRYRDAEDEAKRSKLAVFIDKVNAKLEKFKSDHPSIAKVIKILFKIRSVMSGAGAGIAGAGAATTIIVSLTKKGKEELGGLKQVLPGSLYMLVVSVLSAIQSYVDWKISKKFE